MKDETKILEVHSQVRQLAGDIEEAVNKYLEADNEVLPGYEEKFLVASRAINYAAKAWCHHFHQHFDGEDFINRLKKFREGKSNSGSMGDAE